MSFTLPRTLRVFAVYVDDSKDLHDDLAYIQDEGGEIINVLATKIPSDCYPTSELVILYRAEEEL